jgi:dihydrofolate reductase
MKVSIVCVISLDGYLNPKMEMSPEWSSPEDRKFFVDETKRTGVMIMGQNTFNYSFHNKAMAERWSIVVTHDTDQEMENVWFTDDTPKKILEEIEKKGYEEVSVIGGAMINSLFMNAGLVTDLHITVSSHVFGKGVPLFAGLDKPLELKLVSSKSLGSNETLNHYKVM